MRKNILITGVHGYIGNALKDKLIEQGHQVDQINVRNQLWKSTSFKGYDVLIHTAALVHNNSPQARLSDYMQVIRSNWHKKLKLKTLNNLFL